MQDNNQPTILIVGADSFQRRILHIQLAQLGYTVLEATNGLEGFRIFQVEHIDLVITDWMLPRLDGLTLCSRIREISPVPVLMLTAKDRRADVVAGLDAGADDYVTKPVDAHEFRARVASLIRKSVLIQKSIKEVRPDSVVHQFSFPEQVKSACEQYLLYFVEFLKDIGIDAIADLREDAGHVLFSVTPSDKDEALDNIREALEIYLRLPMNRNTAVVITPETSIEALKLQGQLDNLRGQLNLAVAAAQLKELTIQQQGLIIQQRDVTIQQQESLIQQQIASGRLLVESLERATEQDGDTEALGTDLVKVKKLDWERIPIEVDLPELLRRLKEKFSRK